MKIINIKKNVGIYFVLCIVMSLCCINAKAEEIYSEGYFLYTINQEGIEIINYYGNDAEVEIPERIADKQIIKIREYAFINCMSIEKIKIPSSVEDISDKTFDGATNLKEIIIVDNGVETDVASKYLTENETDVDNDKITESATDDITDNDNKIENIETNGENIQNMKNDNSKEKNDSKEPNLDIEHKNIKKENVYKYVNFICALVFSLFGYFLGKINKQTFKKNINKKG